MKKFLVIISFILLMTLGIVSCGKSEESNKTQIDETNNEEQQINNNDEKIEELEDEYKEKISVYTLTSDDILNLISKNRRRETRRRS